MKEMKMRMGEHDNIIMLLLLLLTWDVQNTSVTTPPHVPRGDIGEGVVIGGRTRTVVIKEGKVTEGRQKVEARLTKDEKRYWSVRYTSCVRDSWC
jgi:hypothetical protein